MYCHGVGMFLYDPELTIIYDEEGNPLDKRVCNFELLMIRTVNSKIEKHKLPFEIWGSAAERIVQDYRAKDRINILDAIPRVHTWDEGKKKIVFRINDFSSSK